MTAVDRQLRLLIAEVLGLTPARADAFTPGTPLFGAMPELDSMAAANLLGAIEDAWGVTVEDGDLNDGILDSYGQLLAFVEARAGA